MIKNLHLSRQGEKFLVEGRVGGGCSLFCLDKQHVDPCGVCNKNALFFLVVRQFNLLDARQELIPAHAVGQDK